MATTVKMPDGTDVPAEELKFDVISEPWAEYRCNNGMTVKLRATAIRIFRVLDENGDQLMNVNGEPVIVVRNTRQVSASP